MSSFRAKGLMLVQKIAIFILSQQVRLPINTLFRPPSVAFHSYTFSQRQPNERTDFAQPSKVTTIQTNAAIH